MHELQTAARVRWLHSIPGSRGRVKLAAIDIGSNSIHMIIAELGSGHSFEVIDREKEMVFLGKSVFEHGRLTESALESGLGAVQKFAKLAQRHGVSEIRAVATSATREASNGGEFLYAIAESTGIVPQVISGAEEARYIYLSVRNAVDLSERRGLILDVGGGSVEAIVGDAQRMHLGHSLKLGVQRLRAEFGRGAALGKRDRKQLEDHVRVLAQAALRDARDAGFECVIGTSGTILALGAAVQAGLGRVPRQSPTGQVIQLSELRALADRLVALPPEQRALLPGVDAKRADSLHVGAVLLCTLLELAKVDELTLCDAALREGLVLDFLEQKADRIRSYEVVSDIRRHSVMELATRCGQTGPHPEHVAALALGIFDQTASVHGLTKEDRRLLEYSSLLHDVGQHIGYEKHEHHAAYIIRHGELRGFSELEREQLALIARYHRKARPRRAHADFTALPLPRRRAVRILAAILRVADGLDRSHHQLVRSVEVELDAGAVRLVAHAVGDAELEIWGARRKVKLLGKVLRRKIEIAVEAGAVTAASA